MIIPRLKYKGQRNDLHTGANWMYLEDTMIKSGVQGLSYVNQQKILKNIKRSRRMQLTLEQRSKINGWLEEKETLIINRIHNKKLVKDAKANDVPEKDRIAKQDFIDEGTMLIEKHTRRISALSINAIAIRLKVPCQHVCYYASHQKL